ncbi:MAG: hypothetical protein WCK17_02510 [Verrucomicrobiota bacterium]|jgi:hypothetical protein
MKISSTLFASIAALILLQGCAGNGGSMASSGGKKIGPGMNAAGEVVDSSQVSEGYGKTVAGRGGWRGEVLGTAAPGSRFSRLEIGMSVAEAADIAGRPSDQGAYLTGQAFNPFHFGSGKSRYELVYKNQGRLIFDSPSPYSFGGGMGMGGVANGAFGAGNLVWIINNPKEVGHR